MNSRLKDRVAQPKAKSQVEPKSEPAQADGDVTKVEEQPPKAAPYRSKPSEDVFDTDALGSLGLAASLVKHLNGTLSWSLIELDSA